VSIVKKGGHSDRIAASVNPKILQPWQDDSYSISSYSLVDLRSISLRSSFERQGLADGNARAVFCGKERPNEGPAWEAAGLRDP